MASPSDLIPDDQKVTARWYGAITCAVASALIFGALLGMCGGASGCASPQVVTAPTVDARAEARAAVLATAEGVKLSANLCAQVVNQTHSPGLRSACILVIGHAEEALRLAADVVDAWDDTKRGHFACALGDALQSIRDIATTLDDSFGLKAPPELEAVLALAPAWLPACTRALPDAGADAAPTATHDTATKYACAAGACTVPQ